MGGWRKRQCPGRWPYLRSMKLGAGLTLPIEFSGSKTAAEGAVCFAPPDALYVCCVDIAKRYRAVSMAGGVADVAGL